jgi:hypothetical protein
MSNGVGTCSIPILTPRLETLKLLNPPNYLLSPPPYKTSHSSYAYTMVVSSTSHRIFLTPKKTWINICSKEKGDLRKEKWK